MASTLLINSLSPPSLPLSTRFHCLPLTRLHFYTTSSSNYLWHTTINRYPLLTTLSSHLHDHNHSTYLHRRDQYRQSRNLPPKWTNATVLFAHKLFKPHHHKHHIASKLHCTRHIYDKCWHGENIQKGLPILQPPHPDTLCPLCHLPDNQEHYIRSCLHPTLISQRRLQDECIDNHIASLPSQPLTSTLKPSQLAYFLNNLRHTPHGYTLYTGILHPSILITLSGYLTTALPTPLSSPIYSRVHSIITTFCTLLASFTIANWHTRLQILKHMSLSLHPPSCPPPSSQPHITQWLIPSRPLPHPHTTHHEPLYPPLWPRTTHHHHRHTTPSTLLSNIVPAACWHRLTYLPLSWTSLVARPFANPARDAVASTCFVLVLHYSLCFS